MYAHLVSAGLRGVIILLIFILVWVLSPTTAWSAEITKVKGTQVLVTDFDGETGSEHFAIDSNGKKKAIIRITKAKGGKAIGEITKGKAAVGYTLTARGSGGSRRSRSGASALSAGAFFGYSMDSMQVPVVGRVVELAGTGFSIKGAADYNFSKSIGIRLMGGYESFSAKDSTFETNITYVTIDAIGRYVFMSDSTFAPWIGAGMGFGIPFSKSTNILQEDSIATSTLLYVAGGADLKLGGSWYVPLQFDYSMFLPSSDVKTTIIAIRGGIMMTF